MTKAKAKQVPEVEEKPKQVVPAKTARVSVEQVTADVLRVAPEALLGRLIQAGENLKTSFWDIGDDTNELWEIVVANDLPYTKINICAAVGKLTDRSFNSVWQYAATASFYTQEARERYGVLPYSHFDLARQFHGFHDDGTPLWEKVLDASMDYFSSFGSPPTRSTLAGLCMGFREKSIDLLNNGEERLVPDFAAQVLMESASDSLMMPPNMVEEENPQKSESLRHDLDFNYGEVRRLVQELSLRLSNLAMLEQRAGRNVLTKPLAKVIVYVKSFLEAAEVFNGKGNKRPVYSNHYDEVDPGKP